jgi:hypothetical protein
MHRIHVHWHTRGGRLRERADLPRVAQFVENSGAKAAEAK